MEGDTGNPMVVNIMDASETSYNLTGLQSDVRYSIRMQTLSQTQLSSVITDPVLSVGKVANYYS